MTRSTTPLARRTILAAAAVLALAGGASVAHAQAAASCTVLEIEASSAASPSIDPELRPFEKKLKKPPFSSWNTFKRLGSHALTLQPMKAGELTLVHGKASLILRDVTAGNGKKQRVSLGIQLDDDEGKRVLDTKVGVDAGDWLVVGRSLKGEDSRGQIVALSCKL
ncbi:MAG TPA: hypothetical protein VM734_35120 [Kofleriaceae bacterium]|nr:hypothetical protein [Kofleriaceae bacterium]